MYKILDKSKQKVNSGKDNKKQLAIYISWV